MALEASHETVNQQTEEIWNQGQLDLISTCFSPDFSNFSSPCPLDLFRQIIQAWRTAFPDLHFTVDTQLAQGVQVASLQILSGTQLGPFVIPGLWNLAPNWQALHGQTGAPLPPARWQDYRALGCAR